MRNFKRILTLGLTAFMLVAAFSVNAFAAQTKFVDVDAKNETLNKAVVLLEGIGVTKGTSDTTFGTNEPVTRQQMAAFIYRLMNAGKSLEGGENITRFEDLYDETYYGMISWADNMGVIKGISETEFNPDGTIILQDAYTMIVRALYYEKNQTLEYPYDYIDIAESDGVDLADGLPSSITYEKELTRGNVAILLYNAFYAETGIAETKEVVRGLGARDEEGNYEKYALETVEFFPRLCEKIYDVKEGEFEIRETPHYAFNDAPDSEVYKPTEDSAGEGTMLFVAVDKEEEVASFYATASEVGLTGDADSYILSNVTVFYTYDEDKKAVDQILFAEALGQQGSGNSISLGKVSVAFTKGDTEHFYDGNSGRAKKDGSLSVAGEKLYFFDAPYSYLEPTYGTADTAEDKYNARNADNAKLIDLKCLDVDKGLFTYYVTEDTFISKDEDKAFVNKFNQVHSGGPVSMQIFDPDGDGRYEYAWYKPATIGKIVMDDEYTFFEEHDGKGNEPIDGEAVDTAKFPTAHIPTIYGNGATIDGVEGSSYRDGDFVAAYVNPDANYIYIFGAAQAKKGHITAIDPDNYGVTLGSIVYHRGLSQWKFTNFDFDAADNEDPFSAYVNTFVALGSYSILDTEVILYSYKLSENHVIYYEIVDDSVGKYSGEDLLVPVEAKTVRTRNEETLKVEQYLKVWVNGEEKYVPVNVEDSYPLPTPKNNEKGIYYDFGDVTVTEADGQTYSPYVGKLCTYSIDSKGVYTITSLLHAEDEDGEKDHIDLTIDLEKFADKDKTSQAATDLNNEEVVIRKVTSKRFAIEDVNGHSVLGIPNGGFDVQYTFDDAFITDKTVVIIRDKSLNKKGEVESTFKTYTGLSEFPGATADGHTLTNVQYIYENYGDSENRVNLVLFYAEVTEDPDNLDRNDIGDTFGAAKSKTDWRIVKSAKVTKIADEEYRYVYTLYNPATGKIDEGVKGTLSETKAATLANSPAYAAGDMIKLTTNGMVDDEDGTVEGVLNAVTNENLVKITDVDLEAKALEIEIINSEDADYFTYEGENEGAPYTLYEVKEDAVIVVVNLDEIDSVKNAELTVITLEDLAAAKKDILSYNAKFEDDKGNLETEYAKYVKAYITHDKKSRDEYPTVDTIIVVVNPDEPDAFLDLE